MTLQLRTGLVSHACTTTSRPHDVLMALSYCMDGLHVAAERTHCFEDKSLSCKHHAHSDQHAPAGDEAEVEFDVKHGAHVSRPSSLSPHRAVMKATTGLILQAVELCLTHVPQQPAAALSVAMHASDARPSYWPVSGEHISFRGEGWVDKWHSERVRILTT